MSQVQEHPSNPMLTSFFRGPFLPEREDENCECHTSKDEQGTSFIRAKTAHAKTPTCSTPREAEEE
jgi:hypothetical protein